MKTIWIITQCTKENDDSFECHFKGYFLGRKIESIKIRKTSLFEIIKGEEYLIQAKTRQIIGTILECEVINIKNLDEINCHLF